MVEYTQRVGPEHVDSAGGRFWYSPEGMPPGEYERRDRAFVMALQLHAAGLSLPSTMEMSPDDFFELAGRCLAWLEDNDG